MPEVELSQTLSRGKADEKLLLSLEQTINQAAADKSNVFQIIDLTSRIVSIVRDIHQVIDKTTGKMVESVYRSAVTKIDKAQKMFDQDMASKPLIYYAENALENFSMILSPSEREDIRKKINRLNEADEKGTYAENVAAFNDLDNKLNEFPLLEVLMTLKKAGDTCMEGEPARADKFYTGIQDTMQHLIGGDERHVQESLKKLIPEARRILDKEASKPGVLYKDISR